MHSLTQSDFITNENQQTGFRVEITNQEQIDKVLEGESTLPIFIMLSGTSESGKSTIGNTGLSAGLASRIKYLKVSSDILIDELSSKNVIDTLTDMESLNLVTDEEYTQFVDELITRISIMTSTRGGVSVVETLKHPRLVSALKNSPKVRALSVYVDADLESRIDRETIKTGLPRVVVAKKVNEKDMTKGSLGLEQIRRTADVLLYNDGSYEEYVAYAKSILNIFSDHTDISRSDSVIEYS
jgi:shikimate kinase